MRIKIYLRILLQRSINGEEFKKNIIKWRIKIMRRTKRKSKGITLIVLVVTIVVLLILAGVTIATLMGDNRNYNKSTGDKVRDYKKRRCRENKISNI